MAWDLERGRTTRDLERRRGRLPKAAQKGAADGEGAQRQEGLAGGREGADLRGLPGVALDRGRTRTGGYRGKSRSLLGYATRETQWEESPFHVVSVILGEAAIHIIEK